MKIKVLEPIDFLITYQIILETYEAENQLIIHNAKNYLVSECTNHNIMGGIYDENDQLIIIFQNAYPWNLLLFELTESEEACQFLAQYLVDQKIEIIGVNSSFPNVKYFCDAYSALTGRDFKLRTPMDIMVLKQLNQIPLSKGSFEKAEIKDLDQLATFYANFATDCFHEDHNKEEFLESVQKRIEKEFLYVFKDKEGAIVSMCGVGRKPIHGMAISAVYTHPQYRNKGYGTTIVYHTCKLMLERGAKFCTLFVDKTNPYSNTAYKKVGFEIIKDNYDYRLM